MLRVGVIGYGYWGPNMVRNFNEAAGAKVVAVSDLRTERLALVDTRYPGIRTTTNSEDLFNDDQIDAIIVASPVSTHFDLAMQALTHGKHVLVEKPMTKTVAEAEQLLAMAAKKQLLLMVDHTFVYTGAVRKIREIIDRGDLGDILYYDSMRVNLGLFQPDVDVLWDLAVHDVSILEYLLDDRPIAISATGISHIDGGQENVAYLTLFFERSMIAHVNVNWLAPVKIRKCLVGGSLKMIEYDDLEPSEKIKVYDKGITVNSSEEDKYKLRVGYRAGDMWAPQLDRVEALNREANHFIDCIENGTQPQTGGEQGLNVVRILEAASRSMQEKGRLIEL